MINIVQTNGFPTFVLNEHDKFISAFNISLHV